MFRAADQASAAMIVGVVVTLALSGCGQSSRAPDLPHAPTSLTPRFYAPRGWAWGHLKLADGTALRYGVASPPVVPKGAVLILPDRDEPAEVWFETANDLLDRGYTVWLLESAAGRGPGALEPARGAVSGMVGTVIRPRPGKPLVLIAQGLGATLALRAIGEGRAPGLSGAVLASPALDVAGIDGPANPDQTATLAEWLSRARAGWVSLPGDGQPRLNRRAASGLDPKRAGLAATWRRSDPSLKPRRTTFGWVWGYDQAIRAARETSPFARVETPVIMAAEAEDTASAHACGRLSTCTVWAAPTTAPHLARDEVRKLWLNKISGLFGKPN